MRDAPTLRSTGCDLTVRLARCRYGQPASFYSKLRTAGVKTLVRPFFDKTKYLPVSSYRPFAAFSTQYVKNNFNLSICKFENSAQFFVHLLLARAGQPALRNSAAQSNPILFFYLIQKIAGQTFPHLRTDIRSEN